MAATPRSEALATSCSSAELTFVNTKKSSLGLKSAVDLFRSSIPTDVPARDRRARSRLPPAYAATKHVFLRLQLPERRGFVHDLHNAGGNHRMLLLSLKANGRRILTKCA